MDIKNLALIEVLDQGHPEHQEGPAVVENLQEAAVTQGVVLTVTSGEEDFGTDWEEDSVLDVSAE